MKKIEPGLTASSFSVPLSISLYIHIWSWGGGVISNILTQFCGAALAQWAEGQNQLLQIVLWPPQVSHRICATTYKLNKQTSRTIFFYKNAENRVNVNFAWKNWRLIQSKTWVVLYSNQWKAWVSYYLKVNNLILQEHGLSPQDEWCYSQTYSPTPFLFFPHTAKDVLNSQPSCLHLLGAGITRHTSCQVLSSDFRQVLHQLHYFPSSRFLSHYRQVRWIINSIKLSRKTVSSFWVRLKQRVWGRGRRRAAFSLVLECLRLKEVFFKEISFYCLHSSK